MIISEGKQETLASMPKNTNPALYDKNRLISWVGSTMLITGSEEELCKFEAISIKLEQEEAPVIHSFSPGIYTRELHMKAGNIALGHKQRFEHLNIMLKGKVSMLIEGKLIEMAAPLRFIGKPGRKVGYVIEDTVWLNIFATEETNIEKLEETLFDKSPEWKERVSNSLLCDYKTKEKDRNSYFSILKEFGISPEQAEKEVNFKGDLIELPFGSYKLLLSKSPIHGQGLFATANIVSGEIIAPARINNCRTIAGRYTNHSHSPNAIMKKTYNGDVNLVALRNISGCKGGLKGEEITINYRDALILNGRKQICQV